MTSTKENPTDLYFHRASQINGTPQEKTENGIKRLKRELLGICGRKATKSVDEVISGLINTNIASNNMDAHEILNQIKDTPLRYCTPIFDDHRSLMIEEITNPKGKTLYKVKAYNSGY